MRFMQEEEIALNMALYKKMYLARQAEIAIQEHYSEDDMKTPMHMSMGSEHISAGVCQALGEDDVVFGTYRSHALYLSKTEETDKFFCEMYGKANGIAKGKAGSMHLCNPEYGFMGASAIVGSIIPVAVGHAFGQKFLGEDDITVVFFGDGATEEGVFWESINLACVQKLPILFVCEDNGLAMHTSSSDRRGYENIKKIVEKFNCITTSIESTDATRVHTAASFLNKRIKKEHKPGFLYTRYYRYLEHVGVNKDFDRGYRSEADYKKALEDDPLVITRRTLRNLDVEEIRIQLMENLIKTKIAASIQLAKESSFADTSELYEDVFHG